MANRFGKQSWNPRDPSASRLSRAICLENEVSSTHEKNSPQAFASITPEKQFDRNSKYIELGIDQAKFGYNTEAILW
ncbi:hypothetical protein T265_04628 [Opisthorchis viverrini]|uniref:Uncharacterized protein n=1 Tax=Opisthorchis viverrini TaxID=6198 RepID=A0A075AGB2_OPIVI|nr:hypothetical protein T265_04628 [Opisthorchis viverrini]KER28584.1 hypothetical protein T265_04628 [Opisthorchis viverrini]